MKWITWIDFLNNWDWLVLWIWDGNCFSKNVICNTYKITKLVTGDKINYGLWNPCIIMNNLNKKFMNKLYIIVISSLAEGNALCKTALRRSTHFPMRGRKEFYIFLIKYNYDEIISDWSINNNTFINSNHFRNYLRYQAK